MKAQVVYQRFSYSIQFQFLGAASCRKLNVDFKNDSDQFFKACRYHLTRVFSTKQFHRKVHDSIKGSNKEIDASFTLAVVLQKNSSKIFMKYFVSFFLRYTIIPSIKMKQNNRPHHCSTSFWAFFKSRDMQKHNIFCTSASKMRFGHDFCRKYTLFWAGKKFKRKKHTFLV